MNKGILKRMGLLLDIRDLVDFIDTSNKKDEDLRIRQMIEVYAAKSGKEPKEIRELCKSAISFNYIKDDFNKFTVNPKEGRLLLKKKLGFPTGVFNDYLSSNAWVNLMIGGLSGALILFIIQYIMGVYE